MLGVTAPPGEAAPPALSEDAAYAEVRRVVAAAASPEQAAQLGAAAFPAGAAAHIGLVRRAMAVSAGLGARQAAAQFTGKTEAVVDRQTFVAGPVGGLWDKTAATRVVGTKVSMLWSKGVMYSGTLTSYDASTGQWLRPCLLAPLTACVRMCLPAERPVAGTTPSPTLRKRLTTGAISPPSLDLQVNTPLRTTTVTSSNTICRSVVPGVTGIDWLE